MTPRSVSFTSATLLGRLAGAPQDQAAWQEFVDRYGPHLVRWCRRHGCPDSEVEDVTQEVLTKLMQAFRTFRYDPQCSFRSWLMTITRNATTDLFRSRQWRVRGTGDTKLEEQLQQIPAPDDLAEQLEKEFEQELLEQASATVRARSSESAWQAFERTALAEQDPKTVAAHLATSVANVYMMRSRVTAQIRDELWRLWQEVNGSA